MADEALSLTTEIGRRLGGSSLVVALALRTAFLCLRRSSEVRGLTRAQIGEAGIQWTATKRRNGHGCRSDLILWSDNLRATIDEALAIERPFVACSWFVFGNLKGQRYTRGGWKCALSKLMRPREHRRKLLKAEAKRDADLCSFPSMPHSALIGRSTPKTDAHVPTIGAGNGQKIGTRRCLSY